MTAQPDLFGDSDKAVGQAAALAAVDDWRERAERAVLMLSITGAPFTSEDVTARAGLPRGEGQGMNRNNAVGALVSTCVQRGWIVRVGETSARRRSQHSARLASWQGTCQAARVAERRGIV